jgi:hypothetical protein
VGLRGKQYCILNTQYTKEEYEGLVPQIIEHMRKDGNSAAVNSSGASGSWGEYFPARLSTFAYNESVSSEEFPLLEEEVRAQGWKWRDEREEIPRVHRMIPARQLPDRIDDIPDDVLNWAIQCEETGRPYRITKQELACYRKMRLPIPRLHPDERYRRRMLLRNPRKLWTRTCAKCGNRIQTSYAPDRPEVVYCEKCYLETVY